MLILQGIEQLDYQIWLFAWNGKYILYYIGAMLNAFLLEVTGGGGGYWSVLNFLIKKDFSDLFKNWCTPQRGVQFFLIIQ